MKKSYIAMMAALSFSAFSGSSLKITEKVDFPDVVNKSIIIKSQSNLKQLINSHYAFSRNTDYPTQIIRIQSDLINSEKDCESVLEEIDDFFSSKITFDKFYYNILTTCSYDPDTELAVKFSLDSYFDPLDDEAIAYLKTYLDEHNGHDLLGVPFVVENATGLVVSLNVDAGIAEGEFDEILKRYRHDNNTLYFSSNYQMNQVMLHDVQERFFSNDPEKILPFMQKWFFNYCRPIYNHVLKISNYVLLQPERIFMMETAPKAYTSPLRMYFAHHCDRYKNQHCL